MPKIEYVIPFEKNTKNFVKFQVDYDYRNPDPTAFSGGAYIPRAVLPDGKDYEVVLTVRKVNGKA